MKKMFLWVTGLVGLSLLLSGCVSTLSGGASNLANSIADNNLFKPASYSSKQGPYLVVIPGEIKSNHATFVEKVTPNNIADYAELELSNANFRVLERSDLDHSMRELQLAFDMGNPSALKKFKRGKFKSTEWLVKFDILKAEPTGEASTGIDLAQMAYVFGVGGTAGRAMETTQANQDAEVWLVGMRYKVINANTSEQVTSGYFEEKRELGASGFTAIGLRSSSAGGTGMDTIVHRLVQKAVANMDKKK